MASLLASTWVRVCILYMTLWSDTRFLLGTWHKPGEPYDASKVHDDIKYTKEDDEAIHNWIAGENSRRLAVV